MALKDTKNKTIGTHFRQNLVTWNNPIAKRNKKLNKQIKRNF